VAGAVLAHQIGVRARVAGRAINYPLVGAAGYTGLMVWHGGFSGSAPLKVTEGVPATPALPGGGPPIPLDQTLFSSLNIGVSLGLLVFVPWLLSRMAGGNGERVPEGVSEQEPLAPTDDERFPVMGRVLGLLVVALGVTALAGRVGAAESWWRALGLDAVILLLVMAGLLLFGTPLRYGRNFLAAVPEAGGILLQFPFYFGILGILQAAGMVEMLASRSADMARGLAGLGLPLQWSFDVVTFVSAGLVNLFVPSGGGQWAVQGTILVQATEELGLPLPRAVMALAYGDEWTNMLQPFWALALLGITGLKARDILGYTMTVMLCSLIVYLGAFALL
jgi:short-chain fatty acids transporter